MRACRLTCGGISPEEPPLKRSLVWRRGWAFEVALATRAPTEGASPLVSPHAGEPLPRGHPRSNPTLYERLFRFLLLHGRSSSSWRYGGEGGIRTHGRVTPTHAFQACRFGHSRTSPHAYLRAGRILAWPRKGRLPDCRRRRNPSSVFSRDSTAFVRVEQPVDQAREGAVTREDSGDWESVRRAVHRERGRLP